MAKLLLGKEVTDALNANLQTRTAALRDKGVVPTLGIIRVGENPSDLSYEKGATKRAELVGVAVKNYLLPEDATKEQVLEVIDQVNADDAVHGRGHWPLPGGGQARSHDAHGQECHRHRVPHQDREYR